MKRREFITLLGGAATSWPLTARGQQPAIPLVGYLRSHTLPELDASRRVTAFRRGLNEIGYVEGQNIAVEYQSAEGQAERLVHLLADLLRRQVAVIVGNAPAALAAKAATTTVPIIFVIGGDPVKEGFVTSLNRPSGNVTGASFTSADVGAKQLGLLRDVRRSRPRIAVLVDPKWPITEPYISGVRAAASTVGQDIVVLHASADQEIETAFTMLVQREAGALLVGLGGFLNSQSDRIVALAARHAIPSMFTWREAVAGGGLMSYAPSFTDAYRQAGLQVGRVLKGDKPSDLPVMLPTKFEFVISRP